MIIICKHFVDLAVMEHGSRGIAELMFNDCRCTTIYEIPAVKKHAIRNGIKLSVTSIKIIDAPVKVEAVATDLPSWSEGTGDRRETQEELKKEGTLGMRTTSAVSSLRSTSEFAGDEPQVLLKMISVKEKKLGIKLFDLTLPEIYFPIFSSMCRRSRPANLTAKSRKR